MFIKNVKLALAMVLLIPAVAFAGTEDWEGVFLMKMDHGRIERVVHTPSFVQFLFIRSGKCSHFSKGSIINGYLFKHDVDFCTSFPVRKFVQEVEKVGPIVEYKVKLGPTYPKNLSLISEKQA